MSLPVPYYSEGGITLFLGDCRDILPHLPKSAAIVSDPPYGMKWDTQAIFKPGKNGTGAIPLPKDYPPIYGDDEPFDPTPWLVFSQIILWGFHHFSPRLPVGSVLVWLKRYDEGFGSYLSDADLAWMKGGHGIYCKRDVSLQGEQRVHPTQKPLSLMKWCLSFIHHADIIDPYCGTGTTVLAAKELGFHAIGIEIEERYLEIAVRRLAQEVLPLCD
jgi:DNA modification methylase